MADRNIGRLTIDVVAKIGGLEEGMTRAERSVDKLNRQLAKAKDGDAAFAKLNASAAQLVKSSEYVDFWTQALDRKESAERDSQAAALFERQHQEAKRLQQDAQYVDFWTQALDRKEAAESRAKNNEAFIASLRKESEAIGKTRADLIEMRAAEMGLSQQASPYIKRLRESEGAVRSSTKAFNAYGKSAGEVQMALRGVPAQLTDIAVSLQAGQAPLTVLLQQGGQLRDMFGGLRPAAQALGGAFLRLINPWTAAAAAAAGSLSRTTRAQKKRTPTLKLF